MKKILGFIGIGILLSLTFFGCARIGNLQGGPYDLAPPRFLSGAPGPNSLNAGRKRIVLEFDEYITLDKPSEKIVISPPQAQQPTIKTVGKKVVIALEDTLQPNTTYTIDFADAIRDNNEGNELQDFIYSFSTGDVLDTMQVSGTVLNAADLEPVKGMLVGLYDASAPDSAFTTKPLVRVGRTDSRGRFSIKGIAEGKYHVYALQDADNNFYFSQPTENIAFNEEIIIPSSERRMRQDTTWIDSLTIDTIAEREYTHYLPDDIVLRSFREKNLSQRLAKVERLARKKFSFYFTAPAEKLPDIKGLNFDAHDAFVIENPTQHNDTLHYWIKDSLVYQKDTLQMTVSYLYTDSAKRLVPRTDTLNVVSKEKKKTAKQLAKEREEQEKKAKKLKKQGKEVPPEVEHLTVKTYAPSAMDIYDYISISCDEPIAAFDQQAIHLQQKVDSVLYDVPFDIRQDSIDRKTYNIFTDWKEGENYVFSVDSAAIKGLYGLTSNKIKNEFKVKKAEEYGQVFFNISGAGDKAFVELLDVSDKVVRTVQVENGKADFYYLNPGKYGARLVKDVNGNGVWDTGNYAEKRQPEEVFYYPKVLEFKANFDLVEDWDVTRMPLDKQKPGDMKKQKPEEENKNKRGRTTSSRSR